MYPGLYVAAEALTRAHCRLEQRQGQSETPFLIFTYPPGHVFQILDHADNRVKRGDITRLQ